MFIEETILTKKQKNKNLEHFFFFNLYIMIHLIFNSNPSILVKECKKENKKLKNS